MSASIHRIVIAYDALLRSYDATIPGFAKRHDDGTGSTPPLDAAGNLDRDAVADRIRSALKLRAKKHV